MVHASISSSCGENSRAQHRKSRGKQKPGNVEYPRIYISGFPAALLAKTGFFEKNIIIPNIYLYDRGIDLLLFPEFESSILHSQYRCSTTPHNNG